MDQPAGTPCPSLNEPGKLTTSEQAAAVKDGASAALRLLRKGHLLPLQSPARDFHGLSPKGRWRTRGLVAVSPPSPPVTQQEGGKDG